MLVTLLIRVSAQCCGLVGLFPAVSHRGASDKLVAALRQTSHPCGAQPPHLSGVSPETNNGKLSVVSSFNLERSIRL
ncbi:hypothetical protein B0H14DRAFT_2994779 [Mycena olivaceomarginata]|nr:hypothetical protein B0H14DRAFT_2994779 [Mycena olivaceomarginata]